MRTLNKSLLGTSHSQVHTRRAYKTLNGELSFSEECGTSQLVGTLRVSRNIEEIHTIIRNGVVLAVSIQYNVNPFAVGVNMENTQAVEVVSIQLLKSRVNV